MSDGAKSLMTGPKIKQTDTEKRGREGTGFYNKKADATFSSLFLMAMTDIIMQTG